MALGGHRIAATTLLVVTLALFANFPRTDAGYLPRFLCDSLRTSFRVGGCLSSRIPSLYCLTIYRFSTRRSIWGIPACDFVACSGYGSNVGTCIQPSSCLTSNPNAVCGINGQVCCTSQLPTQAPPGGGGTGGGGTEGGGTGGDGTGGGESGESGESFAID